MTPSATAWFWSVERPPGTWLSPKISCLFQAFGDLSAMVPEYWLTEGGQSATAALLDHIVQHDLASSILANRAASQKVSLFELLYKMPGSMVQELKVLFLSALTQHLHVYPYFHGNRQLPMARAILWRTVNSHGHKVIRPFYLRTSLNLDPVSVEIESVLFGAAILGAVAAKRYSSLRSVMKALNAAGQVIYPSKDLSKEIP